MKVMLVLLLGLTAALPENASGDGNTKDTRWANSYDQPLHFACQGHQSISLIISEHHNGNEDRVWDFGCKNTFSKPSSCYWTGYINNFDEAFDFTCPFGSVLSGMDSYHDNKKEDRRWKFYCCSGEVAIGHSCKWSGYVNSFDGYLRWDAPINYYLVGASSYHDNDKEDRRWKYQYCAKG
ncbi:hypothetical protein FKM82_011612 [Ascaphus truei]